ncbi:MAG: molybdate ABC transporter substrate-binding protein [Mariprofundaceae bacterium]
MTIAVASSLYEKVLKQSKGFEKQYDIRIRFVVGSTGRLCNQILQGAPFDGFIAADDIRPELLLKKHQGIAKYRVGRGYLGLKLGDKLLSQTSLLTASDVKHIAIANPVVAPFGTVTKQLLQQQGLWAQLKPKFVYAQNALQSGMLMDKGLVDAAFISVDSDKPHFTTVPYVGVLLKKHALAQLWFETMQREAEQVLALQLSK